MCFCIFQLYISGGRNRSILAQIQSAHKRAKRTTRSSKALRTRRTSQHATSSPHSYPRLTCRHTTSRMQPQGTPPGTKSKLLDNQPYTCTSKRQSLYKFRISPRIEKVSLPYHTKNGLEKCSDIMFHVTGRQTSLFRLLYLACAHQGPRKLLLCKSTIMFATSLEFVLGTYHEPCRRLIELTYVCFAD